MPEGHTVHRTANQFAEHFLNRSIAITSPQGRFEAGAKLIDGQTMTRAWAVGKQMFLDFAGGQTLRIHLGIYGKWSFKHFEAEPPAPTGQVRARFVANAFVADLRGPTACEVVPTEFSRQLVKKLGPDPLNEDPTGSEQERFIGAVRKSKKTIGFLLMDQSVIAGVGNVYRAELLFRAGIDPQRQGMSVTESQLAEIWQDAAKLMRVGVATGIMITRDELLAELPEKNERYFTYKREGLPCRACGTAIQLTIMATRKLYWCPSCQN